MSYIYYPIYKFPHVNVESVLQDHNRIVNELKSKHTVELAAAEEIVRDLEKRLATVLAAHGETKVKMAKNKKVAAARVEKLRVAYLDEELDAITALRDLSFAHEQLEQESSAAEAKLSVAALMLSETIRERDSLAAELAAERANGAALGEKVGELEARLFDEEVECVRAHKSLEKIRQCIMTICDQ
jgi:hypothetical protein